LFMPGVRILEGINLRNQLIAQLYMVINEYRS